MLVLGRKIGEEILIGDSIRVVVLGIRGSHVRLGFDAPFEVPIRRGELRQSSEIQVTDDLVSAPTH